MKDNAPLVIEGVCEDGHVRLLEPVPEDVEGPQRVVVIFGESKGETLETVSRSIEAESSETSRDALALIGLLDDLTPEQLETFDEATKRHKPFFGPDVDLLIAATALTNDCVLMTNNPDHYSRIAGLELENWTE